MYYLFMFTFFACTKAFFEILAKEEFTPGLVLLSSLALILLVVAIKQEAVKDWLDKEKIRLEKERETLLRGVENAKDRKRNNQKTP